MIGAFIYLVAVISGAMFGGLLWYLIFEVFGAPRKPFIFSPRDKDKK